MKLLRLVPNKPRVHKSCVSILEHCLELAKKGEVMQVTVAIVYPDGATNWAHGSPKGAYRSQSLGALQVASHELAADMLERGS